MSLLCDGRRARSSFSGSVPLFSFGRFSFGSKLSIRFNLASHASRQIPIVVKLADDYALRSGSSGTCAIVVIPKKKEKEKKERKRRNNPSPSPPLDFSDGDSC